MTTIDADHVTDLTARLADLIAELESAIAVEPLAATPLPPGVAANQLIASSWGNQVVAALGATVRDASFTLAGVAAGTGLKIDANSTAIAVDGNGLAAVAFPGGAFSVRPVVVAVNGNYPVGGVIASVASITVTGFTLCFIVGATGQPATGTQRAEWIAVGYRP